MKKMVCFLAAIVCVCLPPAILAGEANYRDYIVGDRAAGMGGAATALATAVESCYYNPAGLALTENNTISLSASVYGLSNYRVRDGWAPGRDIDIDSFLVIPTAFGSVWKVSEDWGLAFSAFVPHMERINDLDVYTERFGPARREEFNNINKDDQTIRLGPSVAYRVSGEVSFGLSIFGVYRTFSSFEQMVWNLEAPDADLFYFAGLSNQIKYNDFSLLPVLGAHYRPGSNWSFGLSAQPPSFNLGGSGELFYTYQETEGVRFAMYVKDARTRNTIPARVAGGVAWSEPGRYALAFDLIYNFYASGNRLKGKTQDGDTAIYPFKNRPVVDFSLGGEYYLAENYPLRAGFFTSLSSAPTPTGIETASYPAKIDKYGLTASIGRETANTSFNLGLNYSWGTGHHLGFREGEGIVRVSARESFVYVFAGSSYFF